MSDKALTAQAARIGPGRFIAVVGPSGAGKDTIIRAAQSALADDERYVFPQRVVTRPASIHEDNIGVGAAEYEQIRARAGFALAWDAHGHRYGVPIAVDDAVRAGRTIVCNLSRAVLDQARSRYVHCLIVEITAPADVLAARIAGRVRASDGDPERRLERRTPAEPFRADIVIQNIAAPAEACETFLRYIRGLD